jgi:hypothetical protein
MMTFFLPPLLSESGAASILQTGLDTSQSIAQTWDKQWLTIFQSELYHSINLIGVLFSVGALLIFMIKFGREMIVDGVFEQSLLSLVMPILVIVLLANNGYVLAHGTLEMRNVIHNLSNKVMSSTLLEVKLESAIESSVDEGAISSEISALLSQCQGMTGQKQTDCLQAANNQAQQIIQSYSDAHPGSTLGRSLLNLLSLDPIVRGIEGGGAEASDPANAVFGGLGYLGGMVNDFSESLIRIVLLAFQWAFANLLEIALILTGLVGPLAVAGLLIFDGKPFFAWITGFFSLGMAQLCYNIIVGLAAEVVVNAQVTDTLGFLVITALLAPALALAIASGGGMAVFGVMAGGSAQIMSSLTGALPEIKI